MGGLAIDLLKKAYLVSLPGGRNDLLPFSSPKSEGRQMNRGDIPYNLYPKLVV